MTPRIPRKLKKRLKKKHSGIRASILDSKGKFIKSEAHFLSQKEFEDLVDWMSKNQDKIKFI